MKTILFINSFFIVVIGSFLLISNFENLKQGAINLDTKVFTLVDAATTALHSPWKPISKYHDIVCAVAATRTGSGGPTTTVKFVGTVFSPEDGTPSSTQNPSETNQWSYLSFTDLSTTTSTQGVVGIVLNQVTSTQLVRLNTDFIAQFKAVVTSHTTGTVSVDCIHGDNK